MRKLLIWIVRIAVLLLLARVVFWAWEQYQAGGAVGPTVEISEFDKI